MTIEFDGQNNKLGTTTANSVTIKTNDTDAVTIDSSQNVGIGTSSPATNLTVSTSTQYNGIYLTNGTNTTAKIIGFTSGNDGGGLTLATGGTEDIKLISGTGLSFDGGSNYLDDYEEGTHTATITPNTSGSVTLQSANQTLSYVKVGNIVHVSGYLRVDSVSSPIGIIQISLPFTSGSGNQYRSAGSVSLNAVVNNNVADFWSIVDANSSTLLIYMGDNSSVVSDSAQQLTGGTDMRIQVTYYV